MQQIDITQPNDEQPKNTVILHKPFSSKELKV